jgi:hypothetical protein
MCSASFLRRLHKFQSDVFPSTCHIHLGEEFPPSMGPRSTREIVVKAGFVHAGTATMSVYAIGI